MSLRTALLAGCLATSALVAVPVASTAYLAMTGLHRHPYFAQAPLWTRATAWTHYAPQAKANWFAAAIVGMSGFMGLFPLLLSAGGAAMLYRRAERPLHGKSDYADQAEAKRSGIAYSKRPRGDAVLLGRTAGVLGLGRRYISLPSDEHVAMYAMTGAGKGVAFVVPNCLAWEGSLVALDIKGELYRLTAGHRAAMGQTAIRFSPTSPDGCTHRYNPLGNLPAGLAERIDAIHRKMALLIPPPPAKDDGQFWTKAARSLASAGAIMLAQTPGEALNPAAVLRMFTRADHKGFLRGLVNGARAAGQPLPRAAVDVVMSWCESSDPKTREGIVEELKAQFAIYASPIIAAATETSDFDLAEIRKRPVSIYIGMSPDEFRRLRPLTQVLFQELVSANNKVEFDQDPAHRFKALAMLDEFWAVGEMKVLADAAAFLRSFGVRMAYVVQTKAQTVSIYGKEGSANLFQNTGAEIVFGASDLAMSREISERAGNDTVTETTTNRPKFFAALSPFKQNASESARRRALLLPQEVARMKATEQIIFRPSMQPLRTRRVRWYDDPYFRRLQRTAPPVPVLQVNVALDHARSAARPQSAPGTYGLSMQVSLPAAQQTPSP